MVVVMAAVVVVGTAGKVRHEWRIVRQRDGCTLRCDQSAQAPDLPLLPTHTCVVGVPLMLRQHAAGNALRHTNAQARASEQQLARGSVPLLVEAWQPQELVWPVHVHESVLAAAAPQTRQQ